MISVALYPGFSNDFNSFWLSSGTTIKAQNKTRFFFVRYKFCWKKIVTFFSFILVPKIWNKFIGLYAETCHTNFFQLPYMQKFISQNFSVCQLAIIYLATFGNNRLAKVSLVKLIDKKYLSKVGNMNVKVIQFIPIKCN